jgi:8-oxo-dGTP pyrophosphatase MutT (NUDIX family)
VRVRRLLLRGAHRGLRVYWYVRRPLTHGAKCVLTRGDEVLLVRHTYGRREWDLPGGTVKRHEPPARTARREIEEELGIAIDSWLPLGEIDGVVHHHRDRLHCFHAELDDRRLTVDGGEIETVRWFSRTALPHDSSDYAQRIVALLPDA